MTYRTRLTSSEIRWIDDRLAAHKEIIRRYGLDAYLKFESMMRLTDGRSDLKINPWDVLMIESAMEGLDD